MAPAEHPELVGKGAAGNCSSREKDAASWPAKGVFWWAGTQLLLLTKLNVAVYGKVIVVLGVLSVGLSFAASIGWYFISKKRKRRNLVARTLGYIFFAIAIIWLTGLLPSVWGLFISDGLRQPVFLSSTASADASRTAASHSRGEAAFLATVSSLTYLVVMIGLFSAAYLLQFRRRRVVKPPLLIVGVKS